jgi:hypothetical protein
MKRVWVTTDALASTVDILGKSARQCKGREKAELHGCFRVSSEEVNE